MPRKYFQCFFSVVTSLFLVGCATDTYSSMQIAVRDAESHDPIVGALVVAETPSHDHPFSIASILKKTGPIDSRGTTDQQGQVQLSVPEDRPVRVGVIQIGRPPSFVWVGLDSGAEKDVDGWVTVGEPLSGEDGRKGMEIRVER